MRRAGVLMIVGLALVAGCDAPTRPEHVVRIRSIELSGTVNADGSVAMHAVVTYPSDDGGRLRLGAPTLGTVDRVQLDGSPRSASGETVDVDPQGAHPNVDWVVQGALERYADGVIVTLPVWVPPVQDVSDDDVRVPVDASLQLPVTPTEPVRWHGASPADVSVDDSVVHLHGTIATTTPSTLTFLLPSAALAAVPVLSGASRVPSFEDRQASLDASDVGIAKDIADRQRREDLEADGYWGAVGFEIAIPFVVTLIVLARGASVRRRAVAGVPDELSDVPSALPPAVVSLLCANGSDIGDAAIAGTILDLAQRHALQVDGITSERYTMKVVGSSTRRGEAELLEAIRQAAGPDGKVVGPPLAITRGQWWRTLRGEVVSTARQANLLRRRYPSGLFIAAVVALGLTTLPLYARSPETIVGGVVVATILAALPFVGGYVLTGAGHRERARWDAYRRHLEGADLADVGVPGIVVWEDALVYAAALAVATTAIKDLT